MTRQIEQEYLLCSRCPSTVPVAEESFVEVAADWAIRIQRGQIVEVLCPTCKPVAQVRSLHRSSEVDDALRELDR